MIKKPAIFLVIIIFVLTLICLLLFSPFASFSVIKKESTTSSQSTEIIETDSPLVRLKEPLLGNDKVVVGKIVEIQKDAIIVERKDKQLKVYISTPAEIMIKNYNENDLAYSEKISNINEMEEKPFIFMKDDNVIAFNFNFYSGLIGKISAKNFVVTRNY